MFILFGPRFGRLCEVEVDTPDAEKKCSGTASSVAFGVNVALQMAVWPTPPHQIDSVSLCCTFAVLPEKELNTSGGLSGIILRGSCVSC